MILNFDNNSTELYDLSIDFSEKNNLANQQIAKRDALKTLLEKWLQKNNAGSFTPNPGYQQ